MHLFLVTASLFVCIMLISLYVLWSWLLSVWLSVSVQLIASKDSFPRRSVYYLSVQCAVKHHSFSRPAKIQFHLILTDGVWGRCLVSDISGHGLPCLGLGLVSTLTTTCCLGCVSNFHISSWLNLCYCVQFCTIRLRYKAPVKRAFSQSGLFFFACINHELMTVCCVRWCWSSVTDI